MTHHTILYHAMSDPCFCCECGLWGWARIYRNLKRDSSDQDQLQANLISNPRPFKGTKLLSTAPSSRRSHLPYIFYHMFPYHMFHTFPYHIFYAIVFYTLGYSISQTPYGGFQKSGTLVETPKSWGSYYKDTHQEDPNLWKQPYRFLEPQTPLEEASSSRSSHLPYILHHRFLYPIIFSITNTILHHSFLYPILFYAISTISILLHHTIFYILLYSISQTAISIPEPPEAPLKETLGGPRAQPWPAPGRAAPSSAARAPRPRPPGLEPRVGEGWKLLLRHEIRYISYVHKYINIYVCV